MTDFFLKILMGFTLSSILVQAQARAVSLPQKCQGRPGYIHANGGGFVEDTSFVDEGAFVGPDAVVCRESYINRGVRVSGNAHIVNTNIFGTAQVSGNAYIRDSVINDQVRIYGSAHVTNSTISENAAIFGAARVDLSTVEGDARVYQDAQVNQCELRGTVQVHGTARLTDQTLNEGNINSGVHRSIFSFSGL